MLNGIQNIIKGLPEKLYYSKIKLSEETAIRRKRPFYADVRWTDAQKKEFDSYWKENYGKVIKPWWNKLYESMNGIYCKEYLPEMLYSVELESTINPLEYCRIFDNKSLIGTIYKNVEGVHFPGTYLMCCNGAYCDGSHNLLKRQDASKLLSSIGECVIKPTVDTGSGKGVIVADMQNGTDIRSGKTADELITQYGKNFIVQEKLKNSELFRKIYPNAINTIRLITYIVEDEVHHVPLVMRIGTGNSEVDNIHNGGICIGVNDDGTLKEKAYRLGYGENCETFTSHPDTGIVFRDYFIGDIPGMISVAERLHASTPHVGMISWDLTMNDKDQVVMIEANCRGQSVWFPQIVNECAFFGEDTPYMLNKIRKNK